ncbi:MAG: hypothetical protein PUA93_07195 [Eubacteriales bacterium]|nr:hypothetical protein [Eubacteriales bacterium]
MKKASLLLFTAFLLSATSSLSFHPLVNPSAQENNSNTASYDIPDVDIDSSKFLSGMSKAVNALCNAKEILLNNFALNIDLDSADPNDILALAFSTLDIDLGGINALDINVSGSVTLNYQGLKEDLAFRYESNQYVYLTYKNKSFKFKAPNTIGDIFEMLRSLGINLSSSADSSISLSSILTQIAKLQTNVKAVDNGTGNNYQLIIPSLTLGSATTSELTINLTADENDVPVALSTASPLTITSGVKTSSDSSSTSSTSKTTSVSFEGTISALNSVSTYNRADEEAYNDVTAANSSLFGTIEHIFAGSYSGEKDSSTTKKAAVKVGIEAQVSNSETDSSTNTTTIHSSIIEGSLSADLTDVFVDENAGTYSLSLTQKPTKESTSTYNTLSAYYSQETAYIALNSLFKGRIQNSDIKELFQQISRITEKPAFSSLTDDFNIVLKKATSGSNLEKLGEGDYSVLQGILKSYEYSASKFSATMDGSIIGLDSDITLTISFVENDGTKDVTSITVTGLKAGSVSLDSLTLTLDTYEAPTAPVDSEYSDYSCATTLFKNVADLFDKKKMTADYSLIFTDSSDYTFNASGAIGADLSTATIDKSEDGTTETLHPDTGTYYLSFHIPEEKDKVSKETYALAQGIECFYNPSDKHLYFGYGYSEDAKEDKYVFRNSLTNSNINEIINLIQDKTKEDSSTASSSSLLSMSTYLDTILSSEKFTFIKNGLKNLSFADLDGVVSLATETDNIVVTLDPSTFLKDSKYVDNSGAITLKVGSDGSLISFSADGKVNGNQIDFSMNIQDYNDTVLDASKYNTKDYPEISKANEMIKSLFALPTDLKKFDLSVEGEVSKDSYVDGAEKTDQPVVKIVNTSDTPSGASVDLSQSTIGESLDTTRIKSAFSGIVNIKNPSLNDSSKYIDGVQKIEFNYQELDDKTKNLEDKEVYDGMFTAEYNDHMHIKAQNSDLYDILKGIKGINDSNLLYRYLKFLNDTSQSTGSALMDLMNGKSLGTSKLLASPYIENIDFATDPKESNYGHISVTFNINILTSSVDSSPIRVDFYYDTSTCHIVKAKISGDVKKNTTDEDKTNDTTYHINATLGLTAGTDNTYKRTPTTDETSATTGKNILTYTSDNSDKFVDVNGFKVLEDCLIDTTENNFFEIEGTLQISLSVLKIDITDRKVHCYAAIYVKDETAYAYLRFKPYDNSISDDGFYGTEFFIQEQKVLVNRITTSKSKSDYKLFSGYKYTYTTTAEYYKTTAENIESNLVYYILDYIMDLKDYKLLGISAGSQALNSIYSSMNSSGDSSASINEDLSQVLTSAVYSSANSSFTMNLQINKLLTISGVSFSDTKVVLTHQSADSNGYKPLKSISIDTKITAYSVLSVSVTSSSSVNTFTLTKLSNKTIDEAKAGEMSRFFRFWANYETENGSYDASTTSMYLISKVESAGSPTYTGDIKTHSESKKNDKRGDEANNIPYSSYWYFAGANF